MFGTKWMDDLPIDWGTRQENKQAELYKAGLIKGLGIGTACVVGLAVALAIGSK
jgi:hypothetical protein